MSKSEMLCSIFCSIVASFIFLFVVLFLFKPKIKLCPFICKSNYKNSEEEFYFFKLINYSLFSAYDIYIELLEVDRYPISNGQMNSRFTHLSLVLDRVSNIPGYRPSWITKNAPYAVVVRSNADISNVLKNDYQSVMIKITLRHGLTGLVKVHTKEFTEASQIKKGKFNYGLNFGPVRQ